MKVQPLSKYLAKILILGGLLLSFLLEPDNSYALHQKFEFPDFLKSYFMAFTVR